MPLQNRPDPNYEVEEFTTFADGKYKLSGIQWFTLDEEGAPIFVVQKNSTNLVARFRGIVSGADDGPPGSVSVGEVALLVKAFGGDPDKLPPRDDPAAFLIAARDAINNSEKTLEVVVSGGWINRIPGMSLPVNKYFQFEVSRFTTADDVGEVAPKEGSWGRYFGVEFKVVGDMQGHPTKFDGATIWESIGYGLRVGKEGQPEFITKDDGGWVSAAVQTSRFLEAFCPTIFESEFRDTNNILPEVSEEIRRSAEKAVTQVVKKARSNRVGLNVGGFALVGDKPPMPEELPTRDVEDEAAELPMMEQIYKLIDKGAGGEGFSGGKLNAAGKKWCKENLSEFLVKKGFGKKFDAWTEGMQTEILTYLLGILRVDADF